MHISSISFLLGFPFVAKWFARKYKECSIYFASTNAMGFLNSISEVSSVQLAQLTPFDRDLLLHMFTMSPYLSFQQISAIKSLPIFETEPETNPDKLLHLCYKVVLNNRLEGELAEFPELETHLNKWKTKTYVNLKRKNQEWYFLDKDVPITKLNSKFLKYNRHFKALYQVLFLLLP